MADRVNRVGAGTSTIERIASTSALIGPLDGGAMGEAREHLDRLTKPRGSLGHLEGLALRLAGITGVPAPTFPRKAVVIFAADHGVTARGVSAYPSEVTAGMVGNFLSGGAAINALARQAGAEVVVVDVGVRGPIPEPPTWRRGVRARLVRRSIRPGTHDLAERPALDRDETLAAIEVGMTIAEELRRGDTSIAAVGDMGIGNTTSASALVAALTGRAAASVTGRGTGVDAQGYERKVDAIERGLRRLGPDADPLTVLDQVGGLEIAALAGFLLSAAAARVPIVLDGFITGAAALVASRLSPALPQRLIAAHRSAEPGHPVAMSDLGLEPLLDLGLRLGEGSGAALALLLVDAACAIRDEMATFESARLPEAVGR